MILLKLLKDHQFSNGTYKPGDCVEFDGEINDVKHLIDDGTIEVVDKEELRKSQQAIAVRSLKNEDLDEQIQKAVAAEIAKGKKGKKLPVGASDDGDYSKTGGYNHMGDFCVDIMKAASGEIPEKLSKWQTHAKATGLSENVNTDGGFLVPVEFRNQLMMDALEAQRIRPKCTTLPMQSNTIRIPSINATTHASSTFGGVVIYRPGEGGTKLKSKPDFAQVTLTLRKLIGLCYITDELLEDSPISLQPLMTRMFSDAIGFQVDEDIINGSGANQALGVLNAPCLISQSKESGQPNTTIVSSNIFKMKSRLKPRSWGKATWLAHQDTYKELRTLSVSVGTGGSIVPLLNENAAGVQSLDGLPIMFTEHCQTLGNKGDIILGDFRQYLLGEKSGGIKVDTSIHVQFTTDETAFRFVLRYDGQPWETSALTPKHGSTTISSFVTLAAR